MALRGVKVVELMGLAPGPFCGTILADFGANVTVVQKIHPEPFDVMSNGKRIISLDLKSEDGKQIVKRLCKNADVIIDTFRPGVMEKLGLCPSVLMKDNAGLIYARLSGYGQTGYFNNKAGHDVNYAAMSGILSRFAKGDHIPTPPPFLADFAGGGLMCSLGIVMALFERSKSGKGQIIDASMTEGVAYTGTWLYKSRTLPIWTGESGSSILDGGYPFYTTYKTKDGKFMAVGALEPKFYSELLKGLELPEDEFPQTSNIEHSRQIFKDIFLGKTQEEWCLIFDKLDACVTPVLDLDNVHQHSCHRDRKAFCEGDNGQNIPEPAPKLTRTPGSSVGKKPVSQRGQHTEEILKELGYSNMAIKELMIKGCVYVKEKSNL